MNPALKGKKNGNCNRTACQAPGAVFYNKGTRAYYCRRCAEMIQASCFKFNDPFVLFDEPDLGVTAENFWRYRP